MNSSSSIIFYGRSANSNQNSAYELAAKILGQQNEWYIKNNIYPDFLLIEKEENDINIEKTRRIIEFLGQTSEFGSGKVALIKDAEFMNRNASNALLKILEEPPPGASILLTTSKFFSLLPTIRSRCQKIFIRGNVERNYTSENQFFKKCINFFSSGMKDIAGFAKSIADDQLDIFLDVILLYSHAMCISSLSKFNSERYLELNAFIESGRNAHLDSQSFAAACCCILAEATKKCLMTRKK